MRAGGALLWACVSGARKGIPRTAARAIMLHLFRLLLHSGAGSGAWLVLLSTLRCSSVFFFLPPGLSAIAGRTYRFIFYLQAKHSSRYRGRHGAGTRCCGAAASGLRERERRRRESSSTFLFLQSLPMGGLPCLPVSACSPTYRLLARLAVGDMGLVWRWMGLVPNAGALLPLLNACCPLPAHILGGGLHRVACVAASSNPVVGCCLPSLLSACPHACLLPTYTPPQAHAHWAPLAAYRHTLPAVVGGRPCSAYLYSLAA